MSNQPNVLVCQYNWHNGLKGGSSYNVSCFSKDSQTVLRHILLKRQKKYYLDQLFLRRKYKYQQCYVNPVKAIRGICFCAKSSGRDTEDVAAAVGWV